MFVCLFVCDCVGPCSLRVTIIRYIFSIDIYFCLCQPCVSWESGGGEFFFLLPFLSMFIKTCKINLVGSGYVQVFFCAKPWNAGS